MASSEERLRRDQGDFWDTGKVESDKSIQVPYDGKPLASGSRCGGKCGYGTTPASPPPGASLPSGRWGCSNEDWKGEWIGLDGGEGKPEELKEAHWVWSSQAGPGTRYFRRTIEIPEDNPVSDALLYLVGSGTSTLYINGQPVGSTKGIEDPISTDITQALHSGANPIAVAVSASGDAPSGLIGAIRMELGRGETVVIPTDQQWRVSPAEAPGWNKPEFNDSAWGVAKFWGNTAWRPGARWVGRSAVLPARMLRKDFNVAGEVKRATLYISGLGLSEAYLNGEKVGGDVLVPALSDYDKRVFYLTYDVTKRLKPGRQCARGDPRATGAISRRGTRFPRSRGRSAIPSCCCSWKSNTATEKWSAWSATELEADHRGTDPRQQRI